MKLKYNIYNNNLILVILVRKNIFLKFYYSILKVLLNKEEKF